MKSYFVFDVESVGLHGEGFAVAGGVYLENGAAQWEFRFACPIAECRGDDSDRQWVKDNIPAITETHRSPSAIRDAFWVEWMKAKAQGATMAADCLWPVEAGFVAHCVHDDINARKWEGPYPFLEIGSFLSAAGMDPLGHYDRNESELPIHDPLADARQSARMLSVALAKIRGGEDPANAPLTAGVDSEKLVVAIGIETLEWASRPENGGTITACTIDSAKRPEWARDVANEMTREDELGNSPLNKFLDEMMEEAAERGSEALVFPKSQRRKLAEA